MEDEYLKKITDIINSLADGLEELTAFMQQIPKQ